MAAAVAAADAVGSNGQKDPERAEYLWRESRFDDVPDGLALLVREHGNAIRGTAAFDTMAYFIQTIIDELEPDLIALAPQIRELRKKKKEHWDANRESNRAWLAGNMMTEAKAGFRAFHEGSRELGREVDFIALRRRLAEGAAWDDRLIREVSPHLDAGEEG